MDLKPAEKQLLIAVRRVRSSGNRSDIHTINRFNNYYFADKLLDHTDAYSTLSEQGLLKRKDDIYFLSEKGNDFADKLIKNRRLGNELLNYDVSETYSLFCEHVYGIDLSHSTFMDREQLEKILDVLHPNKGLHILEFGCGLGKLAEYISDTTGARVTGVEFAEQAILQAQLRTDAKSDRLTFLRVDTNDLPFEHDSFDAIIAIDKLNHVQNLEKTITQFKKIVRSGGKMALLHSHFLYNVDDKKVLPAEKTDLGKILEKAGLEFQAWEFYRNSETIRDKRRQVADNLKEQFLDEGYFNIYNTIIKRVTLMRDVLKNGADCRYLYMVSV